MDAPPNQPAPAPSGVPKAPPTRPTGPVRPHTGEWVSRTPYPYAMDPDRRYCLDCGYKLMGLAEPRCPDCGRPFDPNDPHTFAFSPEQVNLWGLGWWIIKWSILCIAILFPLVVVLLALAG